MKKILLGTTAVIALGTMSSEAFAAEKIKLELGGFMRHYVGLANNDEVASTRGDATRDKDLGQRSNSEIYFTGNTTLDNGIKVAARVEMETDGAATNNVDRSWLTVSSDAMGSLSVGNHPHFGSDNAVRVPNAGNQDWTDTGETWNATATTGAAISGAFAAAAHGSDFVSWGGDSAKLKYISPNFSGVTVGASYSAAEDGNASQAGRVTGTSFDSYAYGASFSGDMSGVAVNASLTQGARADIDRETTHFGLTLAMAGFTVGGGYADFNDRRSVIGTNESQDGSAWELGVAYATGPYSVSAAYMTDKKAGLVATAGDDKDTKWNIAATYDMGAGVALTADYYRSKADLEGNTGAADAARTVSGLIAGIEVGF